LRISNINDVEVIARKIAQGITRVNSNKFEYGQGADFEQMTGSVEDYLTTQGIKYAFQIKVGDSHILPADQIEPTVMETFGGLDVLYEQIHKPYYPNFRNIFGKILYIEIHIEYY